MLFARDVVRFSASGKIGRALAAARGVDHDFDARVIWIQDQRAWLISLVCAVPFAVRPASNIPIPPKSKARKRNLRAEPPKVEPTCPQIDIWDMRLDELDKLLDAGSAMVVGDHQYDVHLIEGARTNAQSKVRDLRALTIRPLLADVPMIFDRTHRGHAIAQRAREVGQPTAKTIQRTLWRFWARGMTPDAVMPAFHRIGARGKPRNQGEGHKRSGVAAYDGRGSKVGINEEWRTRFAQAIKRHYRGNPNATLKSTYEMMVGRESEVWIQDPITEEYHFQRDESKLKENVPSLRQFRYWYKRWGDVRQDMESRLGSAKYKKDNRALLGSATAGLYGVGSRYEIDSTPLDVACVSERDRRQFVGRPTLYLVTDVFSKMIVGMYLGFADAGWEAAGLAMRNVVESKREFCARFGIEISEEDWPTAGYLPTRILADRGEFEGYNATDFVAKTGVTVENTPPYRGDMKGTVEKRFDMVHQRIKPLLPGVVTKNHAEKGDSDYRRQAKLTLSEINKIIIMTILYLNNKHLLVKHHRRPGMTDANVPAIPREMWNWALREGRSELRSANVDQVRFGMLPVGRATLKSCGLVFQNIVYESDVARYGGAELVRVSGKSSCYVVSVDPNSTNHIYLHFDDGKFEVCPITKEYSDYADMTFYEAKMKMKKVKSEPWDYRADDIGGFRDLAIAIDGVIAVAEAESDVDLHPKSVDRAREAREQEKRAERDANRARGPIGEDMPDGGGDIPFDGLLGNAFDVPPLGPDQLHVGF